MRKLALGLGLWSALTAAPLLAATQYVTDDMMVPLRSGAGNEFRIINSRIRSGTQVTVLSDPDGDWTEVRLSSGQEGWMRKQYLQNSPIAKTLVETAEARKIKAEQELTQAKTKLADLEQKHKSLQQSYQATQEAHATTTADYQSLKILSEDAVNLSTRYRDLLAEHEVLMTQHDALKAENDNLRNDQTISHGLYAIALLLGGMLLAILLPMFKPRKRYSDQIL